LSTICVHCESKFTNYYIHDNFKKTINEKEFEICEHNQSLEKLALTHSQQLEEINKQKDFNINLERQNKTKEDLLNNEILILKNKIDDSSTKSEKTSTKINENINLLKILDDTREKKENEFNSIQKQRESLGLELEKKQNYFNDLNDKIHSLSISLKHHEEQINILEIKNKGILIKGKDKQKSNKNSPDKKSPNDKLDKLKGKNNMLSSFPNIKYSKYNEENLKIVKVSLIQLTLLKLTNFLFSF